MGGRRRRISGQQQQELNFGDLLVGAEAIAAFFGHTGRWLRALMKECPDIPVKRLPGGGLIASRQELTEWVRHLPKSSALSSHAA